LNFAPGRRRVRERERERERESERESFLTPITPIATLPEAIAISHTISVNTAL